MTAAELPDCDAWTKLRVMTPGLFVRAQSILGEELKEAGVTREAVRDVDPGQIADELRASSWRCYSRGKAPVSPRDKARRALRQALHRIAHAEGLPMVEPSPWVSAVSLLREILRGE